MEFKDFIKHGTVRIASKDKILVKSLLKTSKKDIEFLNSLKLNEKSSRKLMSNYYDVLRSILEAISSLQGYKIYSHKAFTYLLKKIKEDLISIKFERFRKIRNKINYYGKDVSIKETQENIKEIKSIIKYLIKKYLEDEK